MNLDNQNECPQCNSTTIQNKETKWECEDCAFSWDKDNSLDNQIDEPTLGEVKNFAQKALEDIEAYGFTYVEDFTNGIMELLKRQDGYAKRALESECRKARIDEVVKTLSVNRDSGEAFDLTTATKMKKRKKNIRVDNYLLDRLSALKDKK